jgi:hypothetical protein
MKMFHLKPGSVIALHPTKKEQLICRAYRIAGAID